MRRCFRPGNSSGAGLCTLFLLCLAVIADAAPSLPFEVVARYPHRSEAFTQGLELIDDTLYESSGLYRRSYIAHWRLEGKTPVTKQSLDDRYFGEGLTVWGDRIYVLTWQAEKGLIFDKKTFRQIGDFYYAGEGWGLTHNDRELIMSDGSASLRFLDPHTLRSTKELPVIDAGKPVNRLNELEWMDQRVLANVWLTNTIVVIDPNTGAVTAQLDLDKLYPQGLRAPGTDVLNGIAVDPRDGTLLVTGKFWPTVYRLRLLQPLP